MLEPEYDVARMVHRQIPRGKESMKTYVLGVVLEPDEDTDGHVAGWHAYVPALVAHSTWGETEA